MSLLAVEPVAMRLRRRVDELTDKVEELTAELEEERRLRASAVRGLRQSRALARARAEAAEARLAALGESAR